MFIPYTFKVNHYDLVAGTISVTYIANDTTLPVYNLPGLGVEMSVLTDYINNVITVDEFKDQVRAQIIRADVLPQNFWNAKIAADQLTIPQDVQSMVGVVWPEVTETESTTVKTPVVTDTPPSNINI